MKTAEAVATVFAACAMAYADRGYGLPKQSFDRLWVGLSAMARNLRVAYIVLAGYEDEDAPNTPAARVLRNIAGLMDWGQRLGENEMQEEEWRAFKAFMEENNLNDEPPPGQPVDGRAPWDVFTAEYAEAIQLLLDK